MPEHDRPALEINEATFQAQVIELAHLYDWHVAHFRGVRVQRANGGIRFMTPVQADGAGFPDLVLVRPPRLIFVELKTEKGKPTDNQQLWIDLLKQCFFSGIESPVEVYVWRPSSWNNITKILCRVEGDR